MAPPCPLTTTPTAPNRRAIPANRISARLHGDLEGTRLVSPSSSRRSGDRMELGRYRITTDERLIIADDRNEDQLKALGHLLLKIAAEIQFAAGASGLDREPDDWQPTRRAARPSMAGGVPAARRRLPHRNSRSRGRHRQDPCLIRRPRPQGRPAPVTKVLATAEPFGYQSDTLAETSFNGLVAALLSRQRDVIVADADSRARLLEALASFVRAGSGSARRTLLGLDDLLR
jgi:hypothetical protein